MCQIAATICRCQGDFDYNENLPPWRRGYTLGDFDKAEWLAQIYFVADNVRTPVQTFDRVFLGAPLWVRTPPDATVTWYDQLERVKCYSAEDRASDRARSWWHILGGR
jgi:hypothetical protein